MARAPCSVKGAGSLPRPHRDTVSKAEFTPIRLDDEDRDQGQRRSENDRL